MAREIQTTNPAKIIIYRASTANLMKKKFNKGIILKITSDSIILFLYTVPLFGQKILTTYEDAVNNLVWENKLYRRIEFFSDSICAGRATGTKGSLEAAFSIINIFENNHLLPFSGSYSKHFYAGERNADHSMTDRNISSHDMTGQNTQEKNIMGRNIIGFMPGSIKSPCHSYIIIGAHYDHLGILDGKIYPGADSNASGVVAMLSLSDVFTSMRITGRTYGKSIIFVAFDAKEINMAGSAAFWKMIKNGELKDPITGESITPHKISLMIDLDQIGTSLAPLKSGRKDYMIVLGGHTLGKWNLELIHVCNRFHGIDMELSESYYGSKNFTKLFYNSSDNKIFADNGIPSVLFTSGITMNTFKTSDLPETIDTEILRKRIILIYHWLDKLIR